MSFLYHLSCTFYRLFCLHIMVKCNSVQKYSLPLPKGELYFLFQIMSGLTIWLDLANRRREVMHVTSSSKSQFGLFHALFLDGSFSVIQVPRKDDLEQSHSSPTMDIKHKHVETECKPLTSRALFTTM